MIERRSGRFPERLSTFMVFIAASGAFWVLVDPRINIDILNSYGLEIKLGGEPFSADLKGAVISAILIGGWTAVKEYWLGASAQGQGQANALSRIAENGKSKTTATDGGN